MTLLSVVVAVLAVVVVPHVLLTFGLVSRIRALQQIIAVPARDPDLPRPGAVVRPFSLTDTDGVTITEDDLTGPVHVGFFSVGCGPCRTLSDALVAAPPAARFVSVVAGDPAEDATGRMVAKVGALGQVAVIDVDDPVLAAFGVNSFPTLLHTHGGVVTASGSRPSHFADVASPVA
ncbi:TlpA family protein disulfide reductase [Streptoalloteichus hindustanus]|uniref:Thiol-disulfide isomerase or thioredoxin n=1 Tax=Streptoalloteichus hindustanus TaxID=2017 RepID=A0A1M5FNQ7_STRHI|nr:hypothetical protein [Streptoalloteichus hindustanus]SHF93197.1 Thiol-disulfide isomerase or thioredoxin [Streptoalloteichus hindustanus]